MQFTENYIPHSEDERLELKAEEDKATRIQELKDRLEGLPEDDIRSQTILGEIKALENSNQK